MNSGVSARAARWSARLLSGLILLFWGYFLAAHLLGEEGRPSRPLNAADYAIVASIVAALAGLAVAWRWELAGAVTTLLAIAVCAALNWKVLIFPGTLIPVAALLFLLAWNLMRSRAGRAMIAVRDQEVAASTVGVNVAAVKVGTFALSAAYAGIAGSLSFMIVCRYSVWARGSAVLPITRVSANIRMAVSGVLSSCETLATKCVRNSAMRRSRFMSRRSR